MVSSALQEILARMGEISPASGLDSKVSGIDYLDLLKPLDPGDFPDHVLVARLATSGSSEGLLLHLKLRLMGIDGNGGHAGVTRVLDSVSQVATSDRVNNYYMLVGDLRGMTAAELHILPYAYMSAMLSDRSAMVVKRLFP